MKNRIANLLARMGLGSTIARNSVMLIGANILGHAINTIISIMMRRMLGAERVGIRDWAVNYSVVPGVVSEFGLTRAAVVDSSRRPPEELPEVLGQLTATRFATNVLYLTLVWGSLLLPFNSGVSPVEKYLVMLWSVSLVLQTFRRDSEAGFIATEKLRYQAGLALANRILTALVIGFVLFMFRDRLNVPAYTESWYLVLYFLAIGYIGVDLLDAIVGGLLLRRRVVVPKFTWDWRPKVALLVAGWPFALHMLAGQLYYYVNAPLIRYRYEAATEKALLSEVAYFTTAYTIIIVLTQIPINLTHALFPQMSRAYFQKDHTRLYSLFNYALHLMLVIGLPIGGVFFLFRGEILPFIYGNGYPRSIPMLGILAWILPVAFVSTVLSNFLTATNRQKWVAGSMLAAACLNIVLSFFAVPKWGGMASSGATLTTELVYLMLLGGSVLAVDRSGMRWGVLLRILLLQVMAAAGFFWLEDMGASVRLSAFAMYVGVCVIGLRWLVRERRRASA